MTNPLTKAGLVKDIHAKTGIPRKEIIDVVADLMDIITEELNESNQVKISSFGTFSVRQKSERIGRNPKTKEEAVISARRVVSFRVSNQLKNKVEKI